jgi:hypothetical protein
MNAGVQEARVSVGRRVRTLPWRGPGLGFAIFLAVLVVAGLVGYASHIRNGGFYYDDWANSAMYHYPRSHGFFGAVKELWDISNYRPILTVYIPAVEAVFGYHMGFHLAWAFLLALGMSICLFFFLKTVGLEAVAAGAIAVLVLLFPASDATRLWAVSSAASLAIILYLLGSLLALHGLRSRSHGWFAHAGAVVLYALSVLTYEVAAGPILLSVLVYRTATSWKRAATRWLIDLAVILPILLLVTSNNGRGKLTFSQEFKHARRIADEGLSIFAFAASPIGSPKRDLVIAVCLAVIACSVVVWRLLPRLDPAREQLKRWLIVVPFAVLATGLGWLVFIPADPYYSPGTLGLGNRTNVLASVGIVTLVYALAALIGTLAFRGLPRWRLLSSAFAVLASVGIGIGYMHTLHRDVNAWNRAFALEQSTLNTLKGSLGKPPPGSTIYTFGQAGYVQLGIPIFASSWDLNGAVKVTFHDGSLRAYPVIQGVPVQCGPQGVTIPVSGYFPSAYGQSYLVDLSNGRVVRVKSRRACTAVLGTFPTGPSVLPA